MKNKKKVSLICWIVATIVFGLLFTFLIICGYGLSNDDMVVAGILSLIFFGPVFVWGIVHSVSNKTKKAPISDTSNYLLSQRDKQFLEQFAAINLDDYNELGFAIFVNEKIKFSIEGKFGYIENFNNKKGYHLAFNISANNLVSTPEDYEDIVNYEDVLFSIDLGYFDGFLLSTPENDNGIIIENVNNLEKQKVLITQNNGYIATVTTAETDDVDIGEIEFVEWNENSKVIKFKIGVFYGLSDIIVGTVNLVEDKK